LLLNRHVVLTIRNLTEHGRRLRSIMHLITIKRTVFRRERAKTPTSRRSIRQFARDFFATENHLEFAIEALLFGRSWQFQPGRLFRRPARSANFCKPGRA